MDGTLVNHLRAMSVVSQDVLRRRNSNGATETKTEKEEGSIRERPLSYLTTVSLRKLPEGEGSDAAWAGRVGSG